MNNYDIHDDNISVNPNKIIPPCYYSILLYLKSLGRKANTISTGRKLILPNPIVLLHSHKMFPGGRSLLEEHLSASSPSSHSVESINRKQPFDLSDPASYHLRVSMQKHTNLKWKGRRRAASVEVNAASRFTSRVSIP